MTIASDSPSRLGTEQPAHSSQLDQLKQAVKSAGHLLPVQGPITAFVFLNHLEALEDLPFDTAVQKGGRMFNCEPYLVEEKYREKLLRGRIRAEDLQAVIMEDLGDRGDGLLSFLGTRYSLRLAMLQHPLRQGPTVELRWFVAETDALAKFRPEAAPAIKDQLTQDTWHWVMRDLRLNPGVKSPRAGTSEIQAKELNVIRDLLLRFDENRIERWSDETWEAFTLQTLWRVCSMGVQEIAPQPPPELPALRHRDLLLAATGVDSDTVVHEMLIRYCAAFADQGYATWPLPHRDQGFYRAFQSLYASGTVSAQQWKGLAAELTRLSSQRMGPAESILESLQLLHVPESEWDEYIQATVLALRGWASMLYQMEVRADRVPVKAEPGTLLEFVAVRLILERLALGEIAERELNYTGPLSELKAEAAKRIRKPKVTNGEQRAFAVFQLAQVLGWCPRDLQRMPRVGWELLIGEIEAFGSLERRRVFHLAFERQYRTQALDAFSEHTKREPKRVPAPRFQAVFCIDTREGGFQRHINEVASDVETFATAGFFNIPIYYKGVADAHYQTLCPIVVKPQHWLVEEVVYSLEDENLNRAKTRRALGSATHQFQLGSRSLAGGALLSASLGVLASVPLVARVLFPRITAQIRKTVGGFVAPPRVTKLRLEREAPTPGPEGEMIGFSLEEMTNFGERVLRDIGLTSGFARLVMFIGHGSFCLNNPHKSAYDCGACSGGAGGPNARSLAAFLNDPRVRKNLEGRNLLIPADTMFLGGLHNTCKDVIHFYDLDQLPKSHHKDFTAARDTLEEACARNAHERCRRFRSAKLNFTFEEAHLHVEERSEDLAQTRPEFGNASNALCFVGRRSRIQGLYMDRRSFQQSYDATQDDAEGTILGRILGAVIPVCSGINLQYTFSYIDSPGWGSGTKLPHNVASLLGVMDGAASDLRHGLPWQGVEIHEPMRLLFILETKPEIINKIMARNPQIKRIIHNSWAQLALLDPDSNEILVFRKGEFEPYLPSSAELPRVASSIDWYRGWRDNLGFSIIDPTMK